MGQEDWGVYTPPIEPEKENDMVDELDELDEERIKDDLNKDEDDEGEPDTVDEDEDDDE